MMRTNTQLLLYVCAAALSTSSSAFVLSPQATKPVSSLTAQKNDSNDFSGKKGSDALNFPPVSSEDSEDFREYSSTGVSPRDARIISPLQALCSMPIILSSSAGAGPAYAMDEATFEEAVADYFPKAQPSSKTLELVTKVLQKRANPEDTLFGTSICPDEVNTKPGKKSLATALQDNVSTQNGVFALGGLAGLPFVGISGMQAFLSHCPQEGRVVIFFGPHVGVSEEGVIGKVARLGREKLSGACGASLGAYKLIKAEQGAEEETIAAKPKSSFTTSGGSISFSEDASSSDIIASRKKLISKLQESLDKIAAESASIEDENVKLKKKLKQRKDTADFQEDYIIDRLRIKLKNKDFEDDNRAIAYVTKQVYGFLVDMLSAELQYCWKDESFWQGIEEVTLIGGILINRGQTSEVETEDWFQPLKFETYRYDGGVRKLNLYASTFGRVPFGYSLFRDEDY